MRVPIFHRLLFLAFCHKSNCLFTQEVPLLGKDDHGSFGERNMFQSGYVSVFGKHDPPSFGSAGGAEALGRTYTGQNDNNIQTDQIPVLGKDDPESFRTRLEGENLGKTSIGERNMFQSGYVSVFGKQDPPSFGSAGGAEALGRTYTGQHNINIQTDQTIPDQIKRLLPKEVVEHTGKVIELSKLLPTNTGSAIHLEISKLKSERKRIHNNADGKSRKYTGSVILPKVRDSLGEKSNLTKNDYGRKYIGSIILPVRKERPGEKSYITDQKKDEGEHEDSESRMLGMMNMMHRTPMMQGSRGGTMMHRTPMMQGSRGGTMMHRTPMMQGSGGGTMMQPLMQQMMQPNVPQRVPMGKMMRAPMQQHVPMMQGVSMMNRKNMMVNRPIFKTIQEKKLWHCKNVLKLKLCDKYGF